MAKYILQLKTSSYIKELPLYLKNPDDILNDYHDKAGDEYIHNDHAFCFHVLDENKDTVHIESIFVNNEIINDNKFLCGQKALYIFLECFGLVKIEIIINGIAYITSNVKIIMREESINSSLVNMIDYIYDNCDEYLYEEHKYSKYAIGVNPNTNIAVDTKLCLLNEIYDIYAKGYHTLKYSAQTKLINVDKVGDFSELQTIGNRTIDYLINHPEELQPVEYNSGITINKQYYQPKRTLVQSVAYSCDIYENQVIISFLKNIIKDLEEIASLIESQKKINSNPYKRDGYIDSCFYIYTRNKKLLNAYLENVDAILLRFQKLYIEYKNILDVKDTILTSPPIYTNIFRCVMPYNIIYKKICDWFNCGNYDLTKSELLLSFVSISKIYEYFCLIKLNQAIKNCGYIFESGYPFKYKESNYYRNTIYNNTFEYSKNDAKITLYYQPIIYGTVNGRERPNGISLFRNTSISIQNPTVLAMLDDIEPVRGNFYCPDYLIKFSKGDITNYYILDAKHSTVNNVKRYLIPHLIFKYLFSISTYPNGKQIDGMCILCGKDSLNTTDDLYDIAYSYNIPIDPQTYICRITGIEANNNMDLEMYIKQIESRQ